MRPSGANVDATSPAATHLRTDLSDTGHPRWAHQEAISLTGPTSSGPGASTGAGGSTTSATQRD